MNRFLGLLGLIFFVFSTSEAINPNAGTTGFNFLKIGVGARAAALGGAYSTVSGDIESTTWNPAGLYGINQTTAALSINSYLVDSQAGFASVAFPTQKGAWAVSTHYVSYGNMRRTDIDGQDLGSFSAADIALYATFTKPFKRKRIIFGTNVKVIYSSIDTYSSDAYAVDLGLQLKGPLQGMTIGASLSNLGVVRTAYSGENKDPLPVHIRMGFSHKPARMPFPMLLLVDVNVPNDNDPYVSMGMEVELVNGLTIRPGYSMKQTGLSGEESMGLSAGTGFSIRNYRLDYSFSSFVDLGDVHRVSLIGSL